MPRVRLFVTGADEWRIVDDYPVSSARVRPLYLHSGGHANSSGGDGHVGWAAPVKEPSDAYTFDPVPPDGRQAWIADPEVERSSKEERSDVLAYTGPILDAPLDVIGRPQAELFVASNARDTDFVVSMLDVLPDGRVRVLAAFPGVLRARCRNGLTREALLKPGVPTRLRIPLADVAHRFLPGHRVRVEITSCGAPILDLNPNTGGPTATDTAAQPARQTIFHDRHRPSHVDLPVVD
jgi:putative CocE/NonD family hydrolase